MVPIWAYPHFGRKPQKLLRRLQKFQEQLGQSCLAVRPMSQCGSNGAIRFHSTTQKPPREFGLFQLLACKTSNNTIRWWNGGFISLTVAFCGIRSVRLSNSFKINSTPKLSNEDLQSSHLRSVSDVSFRCDQLQTLWFLKFGSIGIWKRFIWYEFQTPIGNVLNIVQYSSMSGCSISSNAKGEVLQRKKGKLIQLILMNIGQKELLAKTKGIKSVSRHSAEEASKHLWSWESKGTPPMPSPKK